MDEAIALYREIVKSNEVTQVRQNLAVGLLYAGRYSEARDEVKKLGNDPRGVLLTVITALTDGAARAVLDAQTLYPEDRTRAQALVGAGVTLSALRSYDLSHQLMKAASRLVEAGELQTQLDLFSKVKRREDAALPASDPRYPVQQLFMEMISGNTGGARLSHGISRATSARRRSRIDLPGSGP